MISRLLRLPIAAILAPVVTVLAVLAAASDIPIRIPEPYVVGLTSAGLSPIFLVAPVCAACAAWEAGRLRRAGWHSWPHARSMLSVAARGVAPVVFMGMSALAIALLVKFASAGVTSIPDVRLLAKAVTILLAHVLLGYAIGLRVRPMIATASVLLIDYAWMVLPAAFGPPWLRHLNGTWISCCAVYVDVAPQALIGALVLVAGVALAATILLDARSGTLRVSSAIAVVGAALVVGYSFVNGMGPDPVVARSSAQLVCSPTQPRVCLWPEHAARLAEVSELIARASNAWESFGIPVAIEYTEQRTGVPARSVAFGLSPLSRPVDILGGIVRTLVPGACDRQSVPAHDPRDYARALLLAAGGLSLTQVRVPADVAEVVETTRQLSPDQQREWLSRRLTCQALRTD